MAIERHTSTGTTLRLEIMECVTGAAESCPGTDHRCTVCATAERASHETPAPSAPWLGRAFALPTLDLPHAVVFTDAAGRPAAMFSLSSQLNARLRPDDLRAIGTIVDAAAARFVRDCPGEP